MPKKYVPKVNPQTGLGHNGKSNVLHKVTHNSNSYEPVVQLRRSIGNQAMRQLTEAETIQPKLTVGQPGDTYEREADRVADKIIRMPEPSIQRQSEKEDEEKVQLKPLSEQITPLVQRQPDEEEEDDTLQAKEQSGKTSEVTPRISSQINSFHHGGHPLPRSLLNYFEPRFGVDFSGVRIHTGGQANEAVRAVKARAFTMNKDVVFGNGQFAPNTTAGKRLLAHELTHTIQQRPNTKKVIRRQPRPEGSGGDSIEPPPNAVTIDLFDPLNSSLRVNGIGLPSPRDIMNGLDYLRRLSRPGSPPAPMGQPLQLTDEQLREAACRTAPSLCQDPSLSVPPALPTIPPLVLPRLQFPRVVFVERQIYDHFIYNRSGIPDRHRLAIDQTATRLLDRPALVADIVGHTDTRGRSNYNQRLSERRARAVRDHMVNRQVSRSQIWRVEGMGETQPRYPNDAVDHLAASRNRRVELTLKQLTWNVGFFPDLNLTLRMPTPTTLGISDTRTRVLPAQRGMYNDLRSFLAQVRTGITRLLTTPPAGEPWVSSDNENIAQMLERLDSLIANLASQRHVVRFDLPTTGQGAASYSVLEDVVHLRPFSNDEERNEVAASLIHEFAHFVQDVTAEQLQRAARAPTEHTREDELRQETESRRHEVYFTRLLTLLGHRVGFHTDLSARVFLNQFERVRTGSPTEQASNRTSIRQTLEGAYSQQLAENAPSRRYLIEIRSNRHAILVRGATSETDLGAVPTTVTTQSQLNGYLQAQIQASPIRPSLFRGSGNTRYTVIIFIVFDAGQKVGEFGDRL